MVRHHGGGEPVGAEQPDGDRLAGRGDAVHLVVDDDEPIGRGDRAGAGPVAGAITGAAGPDPGDQVDGAGEVPGERGVERSVGQMRRPRSQRVVFGEVIEQERADGAVGGPLATVAEGQVEAQLVEPIGRSEVDEAAPVERRPERCRGDGDEPVHKVFHLHRPRVPGQALVHRLAEHGRQVVGGEVDPFQHLVHQGAEPGATGDVAQRHDAVATWWRGVGVGVGVGVAYVASGVGVEGQRQLGGAVRREPVGSGVGSGVGRRLGNGRAVVGGRHAGGEAVGPFVGRDQLVGVGGVADGVVERVDADVVVLMGAGGDGGERPAAGPTVEAAAEGGRLELGGGRRRPAGPAPRPTVGPVHERGGDAAVAAVDQGRQRGDGVLAVGRGDGAGAGEGGRVDPAVGVAGEQHAGQAGGGGAVGRCPPHRGVVPGAGERHVEHPQVGTDRLGERLLGAGGLGVGVGPGHVAGDVDDASVAVGIPADRVDEGLLDRRGVRERRAAHHLELEALGDVGRHDLHGPRLGLDAAGGEVGLRVALVVTPGELLEGGEQHGGADPPRRRELQQLGDVVEVGHGPVAVGAGEDARRHAGLGAQGAEQRGETLPGEDVGPAVQGGVEVGDGVVVGGGELVTRPADEPGHGDGASTADVGRSGEGAEQQMPLVGGGGGQHVVATRHDGGHPDALERGTDLGPLGPGGDQHGDVVGLQRARPVVVGAAGEPRVLEKVADVDGEVVVHGVARRLGEHDLRAAGVAVDVAGRQAQRQGRQRIAVAVDDARRGVALGVVDVVEGDAVVAEGGALEQQFERREVRGIGAPVGGEPAQVGARGVGGVEVGVHVGAAEGVDGLLRIADEHQRRRRAAVVAVGVACAEDGVEDRPLDRIGVLELVDQRDPVAAPQGVAGGCAPVRIVEGCPQADEQVVEAQAAAGAPAAVDLVGDGVHEASAQRGVAPEVGVVGVGHELGGGVAEGQPGGGDELGVLGEVLGRVAARHRLGGEQVGGDLGDQRRGVVDEDGVGVGRHRRAERAQHLLREPVDGGDGGAVEVRHGALSEEQATGALVVGHVAEHGEHLVVGVDVRREGVGGVDEAGAHPVAQLGCGGTGEGDDEQLADGDLGLDHVAGGEPGEGVRLAGAGAGLDGEPAARQVGGDGERDDVGHDAATSGSAASGPASGGGAIDCSTVSHSTAA